MVLNDKFMQDNTIPTITIMNCPVHVLTMQKTLDTIEQSIQQKQTLHHVVVNAAKLVNMQKDRVLYDSVVNCDIINADGQSVVWASRFLNKPLPERVAGVDLMVNLMNLAGEKGYKAYLFGAKEEVVKAVVDMYTNRFGKDIIAGYRNGYYTEDQELEIAQDIANSGADLLFVAITSPKKEIFLNKYKDIIKTPFIMGVGGTFDVLSGKTKRAPVWMQKSGLEWLYRVYQEPRRMWRRYAVTNSKFIGLLIKEKLKS